jgi:hypothetical protein
MRTIKIANSSSSGEPVVPKFNPPFFQVDKSKVAPNGLDEQKPAKTIISQKL